MKRLILLACLTYFFIPESFAQRELKNPRENSKELLVNGVALHEKKQYKAAIAEYLKIPVSDTSYSSALHELYLSSYMDGNLEAAEKYVKTGMELFPEKNNNWLTMLADLYDDTKRKDRAIAIYDSLLLNNKYAYITYFNRGVSLMGQEKYDAAIADLQRCILINPFYPSAHYFLGVTSMLKGNMVQAMMSFCTSLLIAPANKYKAKILSLMSSIAEVNSSASDLLKKYKAGRDDNFESVQEIMTAKLALDKKYKLKADLEDQIVRQVQVMTEKLEYDASDKGFWMQYYVPMFKKVWETDNFEPFIFYIFSDLDIKSVKDYIKDDKKKTDKMLLVSASYLNEIRETEQLSPAARQSAKTRYYIKDSHVNGRGEYRQGEKNENYFTGPWEFYYESGDIKSAGSFAGDNLREGEWKYYYESGMLKSVENYHAGKAEGKSESWYDNGLKASSGMFRSDEIDGVYNTWYFNGQPQSVVSYKANKKNGPAKYYAVSGALSSENTFKDDKYEAVETNYYESGKTSAKANYTNDKAEGAYIEYYENGKTKKTGTYAGGEKTGQWKGFYENGQPEFTDNFVKGELSGDYSSFYDNGKPEATAVYLKGEPDGKTTQYDDDGIVYKETIYEKGRLREIKFFDKKGQVISSSTSRKGNANITFYLPDGSKSEEGYYTKDGLEEGKGLSYFRNGGVYSESNYKAGMLQGKRSFWYPDGKLSSESNYKDDKLDGYSINYYHNGTVANEGWYSDGEKQGNFLYYDVLGNITTKTYYLNDRTTGLQEFFQPTGKPDYTEYYDNDWFKKGVQFDTTGKPISVSEINKGEGRLMFLHYNGSPYIEVQYRNYVRNGSYKSMTPDGSPSVSRFYHNGRPDSTYKTWFANGKLSVEGSFVNGEKTGVWKHYYRSGKLFETENFVEDKLEGIDTYYDEDGNPEKTVTYKKSELNGETKFYAGKELIVVLYYKSAVLTGYSYQDKSGNLVPVIAVKNGTGTVTSYFRNGTQSAVIQFNESLNEGDRTLYWPNGKERASGKKANGLDVGPKKSYYPSGKLLREENYVEGNLNGPVKEYAENGSLISEENYYLDQLHGTCKYYENGKLSETLVYYYGALEQKNKK